MGRCDKLVGREIVTGRETKVASVDDVLLGDKAEVADFKLGRTYSDSPVAKSGVVSRNAIVDIGSNDRPMIVDLQVAESENFSS
jgi:hypothetical protein